MEQGLSRPPPSACANTHRGLGAARVTEVGATAPTAPREVELPAAFARIGGVLLTRQTVYGALDLATTLATDVIPATVGAGVSLWDQNGRRTTVAASDALVAQADEVQYSLGAGPCLSAWTTGQPVRVDDIPAETRWPEWAALAAKLGLRSALSVPLVAGGDTLGAIKVYAPTPGAYDAAAERLLTLFAG